MHEVQVQQNMILHAFTIDLERGHELLIVREGLGIKAQILKSGTKVH